MQIKDLPVVMLAAGMSKRFDSRHRHTHKSLLKIDQNNSIFDLIIAGLIHNDISQLFIILGYKAEEFERVFENQKNSNIEQLKIKSIVANDGYVNGAIFTLLSLIPHTTTNIEKFVIIPSDTIVHPFILKQIFSNISDASQNLCQLFTLLISEDQISQINQILPFSPHYIDDKSVFHPLIEENKLQNSRECLVPILTLTRSFLEYANKPENRISGKVIDVVAKFFKETGRFKATRLTFTLSIPPFIDIDTSYIYNTLLTVKKELLEPYKVK